jgi:uncharacterized OsmC-like protein
MELITITRQEGLAFDIRLRGHQLTTDMSAQEGGCDQGCNPIELLAASVGACLAIMTQRYCNEHGYTHGDVQVTLTTELAALPKRAAAFIADIELPAGVSLADRRELSRLVAQFPVPASLHGLPSLDIEFTGT